MTGSVPTPDMRQQVLDACAEVYDAEGVAIWMQARNRTLDDESPDQLIERGEGDRVLKVLHQLIEGAYG